MKSLHKILFNLNYSYNIFPSPDDILNNLSPGAAKTIAKNIILFRLFQQFNVIIVSIILEYSFALLFKEVHGFSKKKNA